jgi:hypothetical protein
MKAFYAIPGDANIEVVRRGLWLYEELFAGVSRRNI